MCIFHSLMVMDAKKKAQDHLASPAVQWFSTYTARGSQIKNSATFPIQRHYGNAIPRIVLWFSTKEMLSEYETSWPVWNLKCPHYFICVSFWIPIYWINIHWLVLHYFQYTQLVCGCKQNTLYTQLLQNIFKDLSTDLWKYPYQISRKSS